jgi:polysaccharide biosynthesis/export protein
MRATAFLKAFPILLVALVAACDHPQTEGFPPKVANIPQPNYRLRAGDTVDAKFLYSPELNEEQTIQLDGTISLAYAPNVPVAGKTLDEARELVEGDYGKLLRDTSLELSVKGPLQWKVYVIGEVTTPGEYQSQGPSLSLTQAIARAGGIKESGDWDNVVLLRRGDGNTEHAYSVSFEDAIDHAAPAADIPLADYDVVYVPRTGVAEAGVLWRQYVMQFVPPNVTYLLGSSSAGVIP